MMKGFTLTLLGAASVAINRVETFVLPPVIRRQLLVGNIYSSSSSSSSRRNCRATTGGVIRRDAAPQQVNNEVEPASTATTTTRTVKESFFGNLKRKRAGESVSSSVLDADLAKLSSVTDHGVKSTGQRTATRTIVENLESWKGRWRICHAPHIETIGSLLLTSFPIVEYDFQSTDGRMVSHARYESSVLGSGWFNADGRVVVVKDESQEAAISDNGSSSSIRQKEQVVKVIFERFWWDRNGEHLPTKTPPATASTTLDDGESLPGRSAPRVEGVVDRCVQVAGKAMFFDGLSVFPVLYLDDDLCVFQFKAAGTVVASQRVVDE